MATKTAAIQPDELDDTTLDKLSAAQFVEALVQTRPDVDRQCG
jgi:hypothetical protein